MYTGDGGQEGAYPLLFNLQSNSNCKLGTSYFSAVVMVLPKVLGSRNLEKSLAMTADRLVRR